MFNLIDDPWLPVRYADGREDELGLRAALRDAVEIRELTIAFPLEYVATLRMLVTVLQSACNGPTSTPDKVRWLDGHADRQPSIERYFEAWSERFDLFHPTRPFMQAVVSPEDVAAQTIAALRADWSSGNNATLFDHHVDGRPEAITPGAAARALLTTLLFQPGGGVSRPFNRTDSPATKALQVLVEGRSLWETLVTNAPNLNDPEVRPIWEREHVDRVHRDGTPPSGWLDRATWRSRAVQLVRDDDGRVSSVRIHQHLKLSDVPPFDPYTPIRRQKGKPPAIVRASPNKALWRDAEALLQGLRAESDHPTTVSQAIVAHDCRDESWLPGIRVIGQVVNQAKVVDVRESRMPVSRALLENDLHLQVLEGLLEAAEAGGKALRGAINHATNAMGAADGWGRAARWEIDYWAALSSSFHATLEALAVLVEPQRIGGEIAGPWRKDVIRTARRAFERFSDDGAGGRAPRALGLGRANLEGRLRLINPQEEARG